MGIKDKIIEVTAWEFNDLGKQMHNDCTTISDICHGLGTQLSEFPGFYEKEIARTCTRTI